MMETLVYLLKSSVCLGIFFLFYRLFLTMDNNFKMVRGYLLLAVVISLTLPLNHYNIKPDFLKKAGTLEAIASPIGNTPENIVAKETIVTKESQESIIAEGGYAVNWPRFLINAYFLIVLLLLGRLLFHIGKIIRIIVRSERSQQAPHILLNKQISSSFSFFHWIVVNENNVSKEEFSKIIAHENIHASQYHSIDLILIELLAAVMWFNPAVWMMRNAIQLVHEYLADEGALSTGLDKLQYQALLVNQLAEEKLICLSSGFNHSLIKKRIVMMTKSKFNQKTKLKILALLPITIILFIGIACVNGQESTVDTKVVTAVAPTRMNVLYIGADNPLDIAVSGYKDSEIRVTINNGVIRKTDNAYIINPKERGECIVTVFARDVKVKEAKFRVKSVPDPVATIQPDVNAKHFKSGEITKSDLLKAGGISATMESFDFDIRFTVVSFVLTTTLPNSSVIREETSNSYRFTEKQIDLIKSLITNQKLTVENISIVGPDGIIRKLPPMIFKVIDN